MYISITLEIGHNSYDIKVDNRQTINTALETLKDSGIYSGNTNIPFFKSAINDELISGYSRFDEENIMKGDLLKAI